MKTITKQFFRFFVVGALSALIKFFILISMVEFLFVKPIWSSTFGYITGAVVSYVLNHYFTFKSSLSHKKALVRFTLNSLFGLFVNFFLMKLFLNYYSYIFSQILASVVILFWNFLLHRYWTFGYNNEMGRKAKAYEYFNMKILSIFGTRPEAIKMAPVVKALAVEFGNRSITCVTAQHRGMLDQVLDLFQIKPNYDLNLMKESQSLTDITVKTLEKLKKILKDCMPDKVLVHGDTSTTFAASLAAFYEKIPVIHIEAGLRSGDMYSPWPEEINRKLTAVLAELHFAPTINARKNLICEGIEDKKIIVTGNTVIDTLIYIGLKIENEHELRNNLHLKFSYLNGQKKLILITGHRRENNIKKFKAICDAICTLIKRDDIEVIYPVHPSPIINKYVRERLENKKNLFLIEPQDYLSFVFLMKKSYLILTDSGGIQEEAPTLGKPVLIMRENTERQEILLSGAVKLVGTCQKTICAEVIKLIEDINYYNKMRSYQNPYGDGKASERIVNALKNSIYNLTA